MASNRGTRVWCSILVSALMAPGGASFAKANPERDAFFGETPVHTSWSLDAFALGNLLTKPGDAYKYFQGEPIKLAESRGERASRRRKIHWKVRASR